MAGNFIKNNLYFREEQCNWVWKALHRSQHRWPCQQAFNHYVQILYIEQVYGVCFMDSILGSKRLQY